jgi:hypothetical protein
LIISLFVFAVHFTYYHLGQYGHSVSLHYLLSFYYLRSSALLIHRNLNFLKKKHPNTIHVTFFFKKFRFLCLTLSLIYTHFYASVTSVDPDQLAHLCCLIWIYTGCIFVRNNLMNQKTNSLDPDQMARMCRLIWI